MQGTGIRRGELTLCPAGLIGVFAHPSPEIPRGGASPRLQRVSPENPLLRHTPLGNNIPAVPRLDQSNRIQGLQNFIVAALQPFSGTDPSTPAPAASTTRPIPPTSTLFREPFNRLDLSSQPYLPLSIGPRTRTEPSRGFRISLAGGVSRLHAHMSQSRTSVALIHTAQKKRRRSATPPPPLPPCPFPPFSPSLYWRRKMNFLGTGDCCWAGPAVGWALSGAAGHLNSYLSVSPSRGS